ncbi:MAG: TonB C-terminal domain-containing protein, partial [Pseudomonadota bacterium]
QLAQQKMQEQLQQQMQQQAERQRAQESARREAERTALAERAPAPGVGGLDSSMDAGGAAGPGRGNGSGGAGTVPRGMLGSDLALRAREMMRGIDIPVEPPSALRARDARRIAVASNERDVPVRMYVESFRQKIERTAAQIQMRVSAAPARYAPLVSVAVRSDGSIDDVVILRSSGRADTDEAVRRIIHLNARYAAFPPNVAARFDVIEIRRIWTFAETLKLLEEVR